MNTIQNVGEIQTFPIKIRLWCLTIFPKVHLCSKESHKKCPCFFNKFSQLLWPLPYGDGWQIVDVEMWVRPHPP
jgi:hypothetical protein